MFSNRRIIVLATLAVLGGCSTAHRTIGSPDPGFGEVAKYNAAIQIIDPDPVYAADASQPGDSGAKGAAAVRRYRTDQVKAVEETTTTTSTTGSR